MLLSLEGTPLWRGAIMTQEFKLNGLPQETKIKAIRAWCTGWAVQKFSHTRSSGKNQGAHIAKVMSLAGGFKVPFYVELAVALHDFLEYEEECNLETTRKEMNRKLSAYADELSEAIQSDDSPNLQLDSETIRVLSATRIIHLVELATESRNASSWKSRKLEIETRIVEENHDDFASLMLILKTDGLMEAVGVLADGQPLSSWSKGSAEENIAHYERLSEIFGGFKVPADLLELYRHYLSRFKSLLQRDDEANESG